MVICLAQERRLIARTVYSDSSVNFQIALNYNAGSCSFVLTRTVGNWSFIASNTNLIIDTKRIEFQGVLTLFRRMIKIFGYMINEIK